MSIFDTDIRSACSHAGHIGISRTGMRLKKLYLFKSPQGYKNFKISTCIYNIEMTEAANV